MHAHFVSTCGLTLYTVRECTIKRKEEKEFKCCPLQKMFPWKRLKNTPAEKFPAKIFKNSAELKSLLLSAKASCDATPVSACVRVWRERERERRGGMPKLVLHSPI